MKKTIILLILLPLLIFAQKQEIGNSSITFEEIEQSYLNGLKADNLGLKVSCAYFLGEIESQKAVIPLMRMLRSAETEQERLIAALSLIKIGDKRGVYLVKRRAEFCDCERTKRLCKNLYAAYYNSSYVDDFNYAREGDEKFVELVASISK
jgi:uncharacterized membrane protein